MIHHQNADAMVLASARLRGIPPLDVHHFEYYQGGECLSNAHWLGPWRQHLMTNYGLRQNHRKCALDFANAFVSPGVNSRGKLVPSHGASRRRLGDKKIFFFIFAISPQGLWSELNLASPVLYFRFLPKYAPAEIPAGVGWS